MGEINVAHDISHGLRANHQLKTDGLRRRHTYTEGYTIDLVGPAIPIEHAWLIERAGYVVDPTWEDSTNHLYFGIAFKRGALADMIAEDGAIYGLLGYSRSSRRRIPGYEAFQQTLHCWEPTGLPLPPVRL